MTEDVSILICGDICPTPDTRAIFDAQNATLLFGGLQDRIQKADLAIANLECVLSHTAKPTTKIGPVLMGKPEDAMVLAQAGFHLLGLANNHIGDAGHPGVLETIDACGAAQLRTIGAGPTHDAAAAPAIMDIRGWKIGVMAVAEREFNAVGAKNAGAHVFNPLTDLERLAALKARCDYVIVLYHGGIEYHPYPSPNLSQTCRALVRNGADLVLCQHSHIIGTRETYRGGEILYGQGNTVFGHRPGKDTWNEGLAVEVTLSKTDKISAHIQYVPIGCDQMGHVDLLNPDQAQRCLENFAARTRQAQEPGFLDQAWQAFCAKIAPTHLPHSLGLNLTLTRINRVLKGLLVRWFYGRKQQLIAMNMMQCDAHREVILSLFRTTWEQPQDICPPSGRDQSKEGSQQ